MKLYKSICASLLFFSTGTTAFSSNNTDSLGLDGDNLDLYGVLELFKKSESPEAFEKALNSESNEVNNLDLNGDSKIDYIKVIDHFENDAHAFILQVPVNETEVQDIAVIEIEKKGIEEADIQIVGDEDFYGKDYIVEPAENKSVDYLRGGVYINVWGWPVVRHIYGPKYIIWISPWYWGYYPVWWKPWKPVFWHVHHKRVVRYHVYHKRVHAHRIVKAHAIYHSHRKVSKTVVARRTTVIKNQNASHGRNPQKQKQNRSPQKAGKSNNQQKAVKQNNKVQRSGGGGKAQKGGGKGKR